MKVPLKPAMVGLLLGIVLAFVLELGTVEGTALLIVICTLSITILWWIVEALLGRTRRT